MHTTRDLTSSEQARNWLALLRGDARLGVNFKATHGVVQYQGHDDDVEVVVHGPFPGEEELGRQR